MLVEECHFCFLKPLLGGREKLGSRRGCLVTVGYEMFIVITQVCANQILNQTRLCNQLVILYLTHKRPKVNSSHLMSTERIHRQSFFIYLDSTGSLTKGCFVLEYYTKMLQLGF